MAFKGAENQFPGAKDAKVARKTLKNSQKIGRFGEIDEKFERAISIFEFLFRVFRVTFASFALRMSVFKVSK